MARSVRSHDRSVAVLWRTSPQLREALNAHAQARGTTVARLIDALVLDGLDLPPEVREELRPQPGYQGRRVSA